MPIQTVDKDSAECYEFIPGKKLEQASHLVLFRFIFHSVTGEKYQTVPTLCALNTNYTFKLKPAKANT